MTDQSEKEHFAPWGVMVITGTVIGDRMFALSVDLAGAWPFWGVPILTVVWLSTSHSGLLLLETNLNYPVGSSSNTIIKDLIGNTWNIISGITVAPVLYVLIYAYISASGAITSETIPMNLGYRADPRIVGICAAIFVASILWISSLAANRITSLFLGLKIISFAIVFGSFLFQVDYSILCDSTSITVGMSYFPYILMVLSVCLVPFGFHGNIPSLIIRYGKKKDKLIKSAVFGPLLALVTYLFWLYYTMGDIPRESLKAVISSGSNVGSLVKSPLGTKQHGIIGSCLLAFPDLAVASSFSGVTLGLFDYLADLFKIDNFHGGCFKTVLLIFLPPALLYLTFPNGSIYGIGGTGLCATIWAVIIPTTLAIKACKKFPDQMFTVWGGNLTPATVIPFGITVISCWSGNVLNVLPKFG